MTVNSIQRNFNDAPQMVNMEVTESLATVSTTGWLGLSSTIASITAANNGGPWVWQPGDLVLLYSTTDNNEDLFKVDLTTNSFVLYSTAGNGAVTLPVVSNDFVNFDGTLGALKDSGYSPSDPAKSKVVMAGSAVQVNYIAHFVDTAGTIDDTAANIQNDGNIQAGKSGVAGSLISFPVTASEGSLILAAVSNAGGNFSTTISNASSVLQSQVISIPDSGAAAANFILSAGAGASQTISSGNLIVSQGNVQAGSSGHAGTLGSFPSGGSSGELLLAAVTNGSGNFNTTISNSSAVGQSQVLTIPDSGSSTANFIISKLTGTQHITVGSLEVDGGNVLAGISGAAGNLTSFPAGATSGKLILAAVTNSGGDFNTTISNASSVGQSQVISIPDVGAATGKFLVNTAALTGGNILAASGTGGVVVDGALAANKLLTSTITTPDVSIDLVSFDVTCGQAALAAGGSVTLYTSSGAKQYKIRNLWINSGGTNFSGGGGDRLGQVGDGTTIYSVIPAANLQTLTNNAWGSTPLPFPAAAAINVSTAAGASLVFKYNTGSADYTAGSIVVSGILQRVA